MSKMYSRRRAKLRIVDNYKFRFHIELSNNIERWVCTPKVCRAYMKISYGHIIDEDLEHNHRILFILKLYCQQIRSNHFVTENEIFLAAIWISLQHFFSTTWTGRGPQTADNQLKMDSRKILKGTEKLSRFGPIKNSPENTGNQKEKLQIYSNTTTFLEGIV